MLLDSLARWQPFRIDALGLVTIFGAEELDIAIGTLAQSWATDWLPYLGSYTVANNQIAKPITGFVLYNITDGIVATDVVGWFARWLCSYPLTYSATTITLRFDGSAMPADRRAISLAFGMLSTFPLFMLAALMGDWWAVFNIVAVMTSIVVRQQITGQLRASIDQAANRISSAIEDPVKVFLTLPDGKAVTIYGPRMAIVGILLTNPRPAHPGQYSDLRMLGWLAFGAHSVCLGMATFFNQILCVIVLVVCSFLKCRQVGDRFYVVGTKLCLETDLGDSSWTRSLAYVRLDLSETEQDYMVHWNLFPQRKNEFWWNRYREKQETIRGAQNNGNLQTQAAMVSNQTASSTPQLSAAERSDHQVNDPPTRAEVQITSTSATPTIGSRTP
ncbi:hypothetical protein F5Y02DRAFT_431294 [Annulohypoxylon stygium]|nr:hypothetical protein F5Y02DRAFT_431294 [Annulohypoxylon stygium]